MSNLVIVAIPDENDRVWKVSSEQIPHLTLLFLGEADQVGNADQIVQFVEHAANQTLCRFYLPVDRRGELGDDPDLGPADVLFFKKGRYDYKAVRDFRAQLLKDDNIRTAYDSATQFDGVWLPHLTLGYENRPAKKIQDDLAYSFYDVQFNKIAVWLDDFDGPEFLLKDYWDEYDALETVPMDVAMSDIREDPERDPVAELGAEFLAHYGVKGMQWGVRKDPKTGLTPGETKKEGLQRFLDPTGHALSTDVAKVAVGYILPVVAPLTWPAQIRMIRGGTRGVQKKLLDSNEKKFAKNAMSPKNFAAIHNGSVEKTNRDIDAINKKYPNGVSKDRPKEQRKYNDEVLKALQDAYRESANAIGSKSGKQHLDVEFVNDGLDFKIHARQGAPTPQAKRVQHAAEDDLANEEITVEITGKIKRDAKGYIVGLVFDDLETASATHTIDIGSVLVSTLLEGDILEHYGIKGMQWGVRRRSEPSAVSPSARSRVPHGRRRKTQIKTEGGENHPAHGDAIKVAEARAKLKKSGAAALSNQELRDMANRLQLENQVALLTSSKGKQFVSRQFETETKNLARAGVREGARAAGPRVLKKARRTAATAATVAALA